MQTTVARAVGAKQRKSSCTSGLLGIWGVVLMGASGERRCSYTQPLGDQAGRDGLRLLELLPPLPSARATLSLDYSM